MLLTRRIPLANSCRWHSQPTGRPPHAATHRVRSTAPDQPSSSDAGPSVPPACELPPELRDLAIDEGGFLIDTKTGKVINEMGATRFDVAVRALRGELDPPSWVENTERTPGIILSALYQFPRSYTFQVVGKPSPPAEAGAGGGGKAAFVDDVTSTIGRVAQAAVEEGKVEVKERLGGKYVSVSVDVVVRAPEIVSLVYDALSEDPRVIMKF